MSNPYYRYKADFYQYTHFEQGHGDLECNQTDYPTGKCPGPKFLKELAEAVNPRSVVHNCLGLHPMTALRCQTKSNPYCHRRADSCQCNHFEQGHGGLECNQTGCPTGMCLGPRFRWMRNHRIFVHNFLGLHPTTASRCLSMSNPYYHHRADSCQCNHFEQDHGDLDCNQIGYPIGMFLDPMYLRVLLELL